MALQPRRIPILSAPLLTCLVHVACGMYETEYGSSAGYMCYQSGEYCYYDDECCSQLCDVMGYCG